MPKSLSNHSKTTHIWDVRTSHKPRQHVTSILNAKTINKSLQNCTKFELQNHIQNTTKSQQSWMSKPHSNLAKTTPIWNARTSHKPRQHHTNIQHQNHYQTTPKLHQSWTPKPHIKYVKITTTLKTKPTLKPHQNHVNLRSIFNAKPGTVCDLQASRYFAIFLQFFAVLVGRRLWASSGIVTVTPGVVGWQMGLASSTVPPEHQIRGGLGRSSVITYRVIDSLTSYL